MELSIERGTFEGSGSVQTWSWLAGAAGWPALPPAFPPAAWAYHGTSCKQCVLYWALL